MHTKADARTFSFAPDFAGQGGMALLRLPNGVIFHILSLLNLQDCAAVAASCSELASAGQGVLAIRTQVDLHEDTLQDMRQTHLQAAHLFRFLGKHCPRLRHLSCLFASDQLYGGQLLSTSLKCLAASCPALTHLSLLNVDVTDALADVAVHCPGLMHLALGRTDSNAFGNFVSNDTISAVIRACPKLESLALFRCYNCGDPMLLECVRSRRRLRSLTLHNCPQLTPTALTALFEASRSLTSLDVLVADGSGSGSSSCLTFGSLFALAANCGELEVLRVSEELLRVSVLEDGALALVPRGCHKLRELELVQVEAGDAMLAALASHCPALEVLRLEQTYAGDSGLVQVAKRCKKLRELRVAGCSPHCWMLPAELMFEGISAAGARCISSHATALTSLELSGLVPDACMLSCLAAQEAAESSSSMTSSSHNSIGGSGAMDSSSSSSGSSSSSSSGGGSVGMAGEGSISRLSSEVRSRACSRCTSGGSSTGTTTLSCCSGCCAAGLPLLEPRLCRQLTRLLLDWVKCDGPLLQAGMEAVASQCGRLEHFSMAGFQGQADQVLRQLAAAGAPLRHLSLQHTSVTDAGLSLLATAFPRLASLHLSHCHHITDDGIAELAAATQLHALDVYNAPLVSEAAIAALARQSLGLRKVYIGVHTGAQCRSRTSPRTTSKQDTQTTASLADIPGLQVLHKSPAGDSEFERRSLLHVMQRR